MPIYEFECKNCGKIMELTMKMSDVNPEVCENCGKGPLQKLIGRSTAFVLKGSGWYETDFKKSPPKSSGDT